jgi:hypothetical protein
MDRAKSLSFLPILLLTVLSLAACSGPKNECSVVTGCPGGGGTGPGNGTVAVTLVADTLPANPSIFSFKVSIGSVVLTPTTGSAQTLTPATAVVDLMRLQSDTAFLGALPNVPAGNYTVKVMLSSPEITFLNDTGSTITANGTPCLANAVCTVTFTAAGTPTISSFTFNATANGKQGIELDFNLNNAISLSSGTLSVNFNPASPSPGVLTAFTLPRTNANLGTNQLELIEDFTGVVSISGSAVKITSPTRGVLTATETSASFFDASPDNTMCVSPSNTFSCAVNGQVASVDVFLNSDGTLSLKEFEPLVATQKDLVEGIVYTVSGTIQQFGIVVTDKTPAASSSLIGTVNTGDLLTVNLANIATLQPFFVDQKGLAVSSLAGAAFVNFSGQTSVSAIHQGQTVAVHVTTFVAASGSTPASVVADTVTLRWSRLIVNDTTNSGTSLINVNGVPSYFGPPFTPASVFQTQVFSGTQGADGVTNVDGIANGGIPGTSPPPVALRVLYLQNITNTATLPFMAAKIRQH